MCKLVAVYLTFLQFILQLKLSLYTIVYLLLEELSISLKLPLNTQSLGHTNTISPRVGAPPHKKVPLPQRAQRVRRAAMKPTEFHELTQNNGHYAVQGHSRSPILVPIESPYVTSY